MDMHLKQNFVIKDQMSSYRSESEAPEQTRNPSARSEKAQSLNNGTTEMTNFNPVIAAPVRQLRNKDPSVSPKADTQERQGIGHPYEGKTSKRTTIKSPRQSEESDADSAGSQPEKIDMLIVCKIENEFGYPEEYIVSCLQKSIKNDATTCYYLLLKEDKHEIVNLLAESPV